MRRSALILALSGMALATLMTPTAARAQTIQATATVDLALTLTPGTDLDFQLVIPGFTKTVLETDATAGTFQIAGGNGLEVAFSFSTLDNPLTFGANNLPISYTGVHNTANDAATGTIFDPTLGATTLLSGTGDLYIFLGGTVDALAAPPSGTYTGNVTLTAAYTGN
jgi:hypothetical protein